LDKGEKRGTEKYRCRPGRGKKCSQKEKKKTADDQKKVGQKKKKSQYASTGRTQKAGEGLMRLVKKKEGGEGENITIKKEWRKPRVKKIVLEKHSIGGQPSKKNSTSGRLIRAKELKKPTRSGQGRSYTTGGHCSEKSQHAVRKSNQGKSEAIKDRGFDSGRFKKEEQGSL